MGEMIKLKDIEDIGFNKWIHYDDDTIGPVTKTKEHFKDMIYWYR